MMRVALQLDMHSTQRIAAITDARFFHGKYRLQGIDDKRVRVAHTLEASSTDALHHAKTGIEIAIRTAQPTSTRRRPVTQKTCDAVDRIKCIDTHALLDASSAQDSVIANIALTDIAAVLPCIEENMPPVAASAGNGQDASHTQTRLTAGTWSG